MMKLCKETFAKYKYFPEHGTSRNGRSYMLLKWLTNSYQGRKLIQKVSWMLDTTEGTKLYIVQIPTQQVHDFAFSTDISTQSSDTLLMKDDIESLLLLQIYICTGST